MMSEYTWTSVRYDLPPTGRYLIEHCGYDVERAIQGECRAALSSLNQAGHHLLQLFAFT